MNIDEKIEKIKDYLEDLNNRDLLDIWNCYCREINNGNDIFELVEFDEICESMTPYDIACKIYYGDFNMAESYFKFDSYGNFESINTYKLKSYVEIDDLGEYIVNENESFNDEKIEEILNEN